MKIEWHLDCIWILVGPYYWPCSSILICVAENDTQARRGKGERPEKVDVFRGVPFTEWLRIFMTVSGSAEDLCSCV